MAGLFRHEPVHQPDEIRPAVAYSAEHYDRFVEIVRHVDGGISLKIGVAGPIAGTYRAEPPGLATVFIRHRWGGRIGVLWLSTQAGLLQPDDGEPALLTMIRAVVDEFHIVNGAVEVTAEQGGHRLWLGLLDRVTKIDNRVRGVCPYVDDDVPPIRVGRPGEATCRRHEDAREPFGWPPVPPASDLRRASGDKDQHTETSMSGR